MRVRITFNTQGGFGNQLFQLACAINLSLTRGYLFQMKDLPIQATDRYMLDVLDIEANRTYQAFLRKGKIEIDGTIFFTCRRASYYDEKSFGFTEMPSFYQDTIFRGYFQSYKYFMSIQSELRNWIKEKLNIKAGENKESIQVRIGDLLHNDEMRIFHGLLDENYFLHAIDKYSFSKDVDVFTDDFNSLNSFYPSLAKFRKKLDRNSGALFDFREIASSKKIIISNSTFGWWAAFLSHGQVIYPANWFAPGNPLNSETQDLFLPEWFKE